MRVALLVLGLVSAGCSEAPRPTGAETDEARGLRFVDVTRARGLTFDHDAGISEERQLPETMGAGAALFDADEDGDLDLYFVQSGPLPLSEDRSGVPPNELWLNDGAARFRDHTAESGAAAHRGYGMGVCTGDVDGDGHEDLYVTNLGPDVLLVGDGTGRFRDATGPAGLGDERWTAGATFFDADADGDLDLFVTAYLAVDLADPLFCGERKPGWRSYCHPDAYVGEQDRFWRNLGDGRFEDQTVAAGFTDSTGKGLGVIAGDFDRDHDLDLYVANDSVENRLWVNEGGSFVDGTLLSGAGVNGMGLTEAGMGLATGDVDGDGLVDLFVTNFDDESNTLYHNDGEGMFSDVTAASGLEASSRLPVGFGTVLEDLDDDGALDLAVANGHIIHNIELYHDGKRWAQRPLLFRGDGSGRFVDASASSGDLCKTPRVGRGLYAGDLDGDGDLDLVLTECDGPARIFENQGAAPGAVQIEGLPRGTAVTFLLEDGRSVLREVGPWPSYFGSSAPGVRWSGAPIRAVSVERLGSGEVASYTSPLAAGTWRARLEGSSLSFEPAR